MNNEILTKSILNKIKTSVEKLITDHKEIDSLAKEISDKIYSEGRIIFIAPGIASEVARNLIGEFDYYFQIKDGKFIAHNSAENYRDQFDDWKALERVGATAIFELDKMNLDKNDLVVGSFCSGKSTYIKSTLQHAKSLGCTTALITNASEIEDNETIDYLISTHSNESALIGYNAADSATLQKIAIDLVVTNAMAHAGRIWNNHLVCLKAFSKKVENECIQILSDITGKSIEESKIIYNNNNNELDSSIVIELLNVQYDEARKLIEENDNNMNKVLKNIK